MKVVILAGGFGTRLSEYTETLPKPMVQIGGKPIIWHIMQHYASYGFNDFVVALGYKAELIREYFLNFRSLNSDFEINLSSGKLNWLGTVNPNWNITLVDTGLDTLTGTRLSKLAPYLGDKTFMLTYGDGVSNVDLKGLVDFHQAHGRIATMTAVRPAARFGELELETGIVKSFIEKPQLHGGWVNGGFFVFEPEFLNYIPSDNVMLEREPLTRATAERQLMAFEHSEFWQCMDTKRDLETLQAMWDTGSPPWMK